MRGPGRMPGRPVGRIGAAALALAAIGMSLAAPAVAADGVRVIEDAGRQPDPEVRTLLEFRSDREVGIHHVVSTTTLSGYGVWGSGETTERLCGSPCTIELPEGQFRIRVDDNYLFGRRLTVDARGEPLAWKVHRAHPVNGVIGIVASGVGLGGVLGFGMVALLDDGRGAGMALASTPVAAGGLALLVSAFAGAHAVSPTAGPSAP